MHLCYRYMSLGQFICFCANIIFKWQLNIYMHVYHYMYIYVYHYIYNGDNNLKNITAQHFCDWTNDFCHDIF